MSKGFEQNPFLLKRFQDETDYISYISNWSDHQIAFYTERFLLEAYDELMCPFLGKDKLNDFEALTDWAIDIILDKLVKYLENPKKYKLIDLQLVDPHFSDLTASIFFNIIGLTDEDFQSKLEEIKQKFIEYAKLIMRNPEFKSRWSKDKVEAVIIKTKTSPKILEFPQRES